MDDLNQKAFAQQANSALVSAFARLTVMDRIYARQNALSLAHTPDDRPENIVARAKAYAEFVLGSD